MSEPLNNAYGRLLAARDRLIAAGVDPSDLLVPDPVPTDTLDVERLAEALENTELHFRIFDETDLSMAEVGETVAANLIAREYARAPVPSEPDPLMETGGWTVTLREMSSGGYYEPEAAQWISAEWSAPHCTPITRNEPTIESALRAIRVAVSRFRAAPVPTDTPGQDELG